MALHFGRHGQYIKDSRLYKSGKNYLYCFSNLLGSHWVNLPVILCFHRIKASSGNMLDRRVGTTPPEVFEKIINYMKILGYRFVSLEELGRRLLKSRLSRVAVVTFDDGFKDLYQNAYPILKKSNIPFSLFLITSTLESERLLWLHKLYLSLADLPAAQMINILKNYQGLINPPRRPSRDPAELIGYIIFKSKNRKHVQDLVSNVVKEAKLSPEKERMLAQELYLTKAELLEMEKYGLTIEPRGHEHWPLHYLNRKETKEEMGKSVECIRRNFCRPRVFTAFHINISNQYVINMVKELKLTGVTIAKPDLVNTFTEIYALPRFCVYYDIGIFFQQLNREFRQAFRRQMRL